MKKSGNKSIYVDIPDVQKTKAKIPVDPDSTVSNVINVIKRSNAPVFDNIGEEEYGFALASEPTTVFPGATLVSKVPSVKSFGPFNSLITKYLFNSIIYVSVFNRIDLYIEES